MLDSINKEIPRILVIDISSNFGGANARVLSLMKKFPTDRIGLATIEGSIIGEELEKLGYAVHCLANRKFDPRIPFKMVRVIRDHKYQVLDTQNPQSKLWGSIAALLSGAALISTLNSFYMNEHPKYSLRWFVYSILEFITNFSLSRYIVVSKEIQSALIRLKIPQEKIDLIHNAIELDSKAIHGEKKWLLEKLNLPDDAVVCLAAGRLVWAKAHDDLISAIAKVRERDQRLYCLIAGEGDLERNLKEQINHLRLDKFVMLLGHVNHSELLSYLKACDIYAMPSRTEGTPVALLEAAALGKPIIASDVGGIPDLVVNESHALLVPSGNIDLLSDALLRFVKNPSEAMRFGERAKSWVEEKFSISQQVRASAEAYIKAEQKRK